MQSITTDGITSVVPAVFRSAVGKSDSSHCLLIVTTAGSARVISRRSELQLCRQVFGDFPAVVSDGGRSPRHGAVVRGQTCKIFDACGKTAGTSLPGRLKRDVVVPVPRKVRLRRTNRSAAADRQRQLRHQAQWPSPSGVQGNAASGAAEKKTTAQQWHVVVTGRHSRTE